MINFSMVSKIRAVLSRFWVISILFLFAHVGYAQQTEVKIFAHRGGKLEFDENTLSAFNASYRAGLRGFETDIRYTKDKQLVIFHDDNFKRIFGIEGSIESSTFEDVRALRTKDGNQIPTLDEVLNFFNERPWLYVEFEMKTKGAFYTEDLLQQYCDEVYKKIYQNRPATSDYVMTSFDTRPLKYLKNKYPSIPLLLIKNEGLSPEILDEAKEMGINRIGCRIEGTTQKMVKQAKERGFIVSLWPGLSIEHFILGMGLGSDYLCTDIPVAVYEWAKENASWISLQ